jgi:uncharacterized protein YjbI with pentapeptide repeats
LNRLGWTGWSITLEDVAVPTEALTEEQAEHARDATLQDFWRAQEGNLIRSGQQTYSRLHHPGGDRPMIDAAIAERISFLNEARNAYPELSDDLFALRLDYVQLTEFALPDEQIRLLHGIKAKQASFSEGVNLDQVQCRGGMDFEGVVFFDELSMQRALVRGATSFAGAEFHQDVDMRGSSFISSLSLNDALFLSNLSLHDIRCGPLNLSRTTIAGATYLNDSILFDSFRCIGVVTLGPAQFNNVIWLANADFSDAAFLAASTFKNSIFGRLARFSETVFLGNSIFEGATFSRKVDFLGANTWRPVFSSDTNIRNANVEFLERFHSDLHLAADFWEKRGSFHRVTFKDAIFAGEANFSGRSFLSPANFSGAIFLGPTNFSNSRIHESMSFQSAFFVPVRAPSKQNQGILLERMEPPLQKSNEALAEIRGLQVDTPFVRQLSYQAEPDQISFFKERTRILLESPETLIRYQDGFRFLRRQMEARSDSSQAYAFYRLELETRRERTDLEGHWWEEPVSNLYGRLSAYGSNPIYPLAWLVLIVPLFGALYAAMGSLWTTNVSMEDLFRGIEFSAAQSVTFGFWNELHPCSDLAALSEIPPPNELFCEDHPNVHPEAYSSLSQLSLGVLSTLQSVISLILLFLSALAIRRRFQTSG